MSTQINSHFVNTCSLADLDHVAQYLKVTPAQIKKALIKGHTNLRAVIGTKLATFLSASGLEFFTSDNLPSDKASAEHPKAEQSKTNPFADATKASGARSKLNGAYVIVKDGAQPMENPEKAAIHEALMTSTTFEEYFKKAPAKAVRGKTIVTPSSMANCYLKRGWITIT